MPVEAPVSIIEQDYVTLTVVKQPTGTNIQIQYHTLNGNSPNDNKNYIGLWQSPNGVIPKKRAMWSYLLPTNQTEATITLKDTPINDNAFVLGYCQTGDPKTDEAAASNASASAIIEKDMKATAGVPMAMTLNVTGNSMDAELFYTILRGTNLEPHWFGIWKEGASIDFDAPFYKAAIKEKDSKKTGNIVLDDVEFQRGTEYTLAYFMDGFEDIPENEISVQNMAGYIKFSF